MIIASLQSKKRYKNIVYALKFDSKIQKRKKHKLTVEQYKTNVMKMQNKCHEDVEQML